MHRTTSGLALTWKATTNDDAKKKPMAQALSSPDLMALVLAVAWQAHLYPPACRRLQQS
jgi:hypothetical protein